MLSLSIRDLEMRFPGLETPALAIGNFALPAGGRLAVTGLPSGRRDAFRARHIGLVMQDFHLFPGLSAFENVVLPVRLARRLARPEAERAAMLLDTIGIRRPQQAIETLSRGEMQRVAVARALLSRPGVLVADEPTANLDRRTGDEVADLIIRLAAEEKATLIVVTHDPQVMERLDRRIRLSGGRIDEDSAGTPQT